MSKTYCFRSASKRSIFFLQLCSFRNFSQHRYLCNVVNQNSAFGLSYFIFWNLHFLRMHNCYFHLSVRNIDCNWQCVRISLQITEIVIETEQVLELFFSLWTLSTTSVHTFQVVIIKLRWSWIYKCSEIYHLYYMLKLNSYQVARKSVCVDVINSIRVSGIMWPNFQWADFI